ncbi:MAG TPA: DNA polymerase/3'-5' exonuclease PolX [Verrucomicrobiales bacterium]|nr:DNA polymerase/3'-5' exonuclease PolX [Verrucomicrobiales bacterium]
MDKDAVAEVLKEIGILLELKGENPFKTRAYVNGARTLEGLTEPLETLIQEERLGEVKGIGKALVEKITELVETGELEYYNTLKASIPPGLIEMLDVQGMGPKKVKALHDKLGIESIEALEAACEAGQVAELDGFGKKSEEKILESIAFKRQHASHHHRHKMLIAAEPILNDLRSHPDVIRCDIAGSLRRGKEVSGDIDFLVSAKDSADIIETFTTRDGILSVLAAGGTKASVLLEGGIQADLRVVEDSEFASALAYFTGSKEHNIVMRQRAIDRGLRLNEYGLFKSTEETRDPELRLDCKTEEDIFAALDLTYVPPELREDRGEFDAAENGEIPRLIEWTDLKGSLHNHSNWSDGHESPEEIAEHMSGLGLAYWAVTDHSKASFQANGLDEARVEKQLKEIAAVNQKLEDDGNSFRLLSGIEVDVLKKGLDFKDDLLAQLEVVVASLHVAGSDEKDNTKRLIAAAENPHVHMLGHLSGRLLLERAPQKLNQQAVIDACAETGTWIELNANPYRLDLDWRHWQYAKSRGVKCVINCDAHRAEHAGFLRIGTAIARKGWLAKEDVVNTLPLKQLKKQLAKKRN